MPDRPTVVYRYDGSFEGLLCCVFESYERKEIPADVLPPEEGQTMLFSTREIETAEEKAARERAAIPQKIGRDAMRLVQDVFLTCLPRKEYHMLIFLRKGFRAGPSITEMLADETVHRLNAAVRYLYNENHLTLEFLRFSDFKGNLAAEIAPNNFVLPLLGQHFCERYPEERFLIYDRTHGAALVYQPYEARIMPVEHFELPGPDAEEQKYRELWRMFYRTVEVEGRHNPKCRMGHMPKRYWRYMTEFSTAEQLAAPPPMLPAEREALLRAGRAALTAPASHVEPAADFSHNRLPGENKQDGERNQADAKANQCGENHMQASR